MTDISDEGLRKAVEDAFGGPSEWVGSFAPDFLELVKAVRNEARRQALEEVTKTFRNCDELRKKAEHTKANHLHECMEIVRALKDKEAGA